MILKEADNNIQTPTLYGLVLAGGKSVRMGQDKGKIKWHEQEQRYYMAELLTAYCDTIFISCREEQKEEIDQSYHTLTDTVTGLGPFGAILSAFAYRPDVAWLVTACDLPLLDAETLSYLIAHRDTNAIATTFESPFDGLPEPLITIWEPKSFEVLKRFQSEGYRCPRKVLINSEGVNILKPPYPDALMNANTPEDAEKVKEIIYQRAEQ